MDSVNAAQLCKTGRCAYGDNCTCDFYADWPHGKPPRRPRGTRHPGRFFIEGHRAGRGDTCRRLWKHLDEEGRRLATAIATEGQNVD